MKNSTKFISTVFLFAAAISLISTVNAQTTTTTVIDATTNPMYSVQRNDKIQAYNSTKPAQATVTNTTTAETKVIDATTNPMYSAQRNDKIQAYESTQPAQTTATQTKTTTSAIIDATTNPMYSAQRNDKIRAYEATLPKSSTEQTVTTTTTKTVTTKAVEKAQQTKQTASSQAQQQVNNVQITASNISQTSHSEFSYYEGLKTCTEGSFNSDSLILRTYGLTNGLCSFDVTKQNEKTTRMVKVCSYNAPMEATKQYASDMLKLEKSLAGFEKLTTPEYTAITNSLTQFTQKYCK